MHPSPAFIAQSTKQPWDLAKQVASAKEVCFVMEIIHASSALKNWAMGPYAKMLGLR
jgi:hypothetical protein